MFCTSHGSNSALRPDAKALIPLELDFHLRTTKFTVEMDNSSFPRVLEFRNKLPPNPQLLRLKDWFARYDFSVKHIKGHHNIIPDMLSRPRPVNLLSRTELEKIFV
ncbi:hypothetical protein Ddye_026737 [Dipteronia dyeriana]|uniref:Reverse transcriptase RNase H-like domain-containing protein n=1 Tax=Dipteronia dyeriana TaxID=168575 RepID=A0AAD9WQP7_9ROSI|nr:hypothetical protein Ddye_026737 [Dipteronia dyeriana]